MPMKKTVRAAALFVVVLITSPLTTFAQRSGDPLSGVWKGDWGPSAADRNAVTLEFHWDGKTLNGTVNPGPDAIPIENSSFDSSTGKVHLEARYSPRNLFYS